MTHRTGPPAVPGPMKSAHDETDAARRTIQFHAAMLEAAFRHWAGTAPIHDPRDRYVRLRIERDITALTDRLGTYFTVRQDTLPPGSAEANIPGQ